MTKTMERNEYYLGLDLGRKQDHSALVILERNLAAYNTRYVDETTSWVQTLQVRYARQFRLGTPYSNVAQEVARVYGEISKRGTALLVFDQTGIGDAFDEIIRAHLRGARVEGVVITQEIKRELYQTIEALLEHKELKIPEDCHDSAALKQELLTVEIRRAGFGYQFGAFDGGTHDDMVMALGLACWRERLGRSRAPRGSRLPGF